MADRRSTQVVGPAQWDLVFQYLSAVETKTDALLEDLRLFNAGTLAMEAQMSGADSPGMRRNTEIDHIKARLDRVERRLELGDK